MKRREPPMPYDEALRCLAGWLEQMEKHSINTQLVRAIKAVLDRQREGSLTS